MDKKINEEVQEEAYKIADHILDAIKDRDTITKDEFEEQIALACRELYGIDNVWETMDHEKGLATINDKQFDMSDLDADIRGILSYKGWATDFKDGDLTTKEIENESLKEDANEPKLETFEEKIDFLVKDEDEAIAGYDKIIAMLGDDSANAIEQLTHIKEEEIAHKDFLEVLKKDPSAIYNHEDEEEHDESLKETLEFDAMEDLKSEVYHALSEIYAKYELKGATLNEFDSAVDFATIHMRDEFGESLKEDTEVEAEVKVEEPKEEEPVEEHPIETTVEEVKEIASEVANKVVEPVSTEEEADEQQEAIEEIVDEVVDDKFGEDDDFDDEDEKIVRDNDEVIDLDDIDDDFGFDEELKEDTVKKDNKWVNKGKEGTHGEFKTKKEADAQRRAMFANGYHEEVEEDFDDDFGGGSDKFVPGEAEHFGVTVNWDDMDDVEEEDTKMFKKVIKSTDDEILDKHFGKDTPERKLVGAIKKDIDEETHETGHIKAKKPIELRARR